MPEIFQGGVMCRITAWEHEDVRKTEDGRFQCEVCRHVVGKKADFALTDCNRKLAIRRQALPKAEAKRAVA